MAISAFNLSGNAAKTRSSSKAPLCAHVYANHLMTYIEENIWDLLNSSKVSAKPN